MLFAVQHTMLSAGLCLQLEPRLRTPGGLTAWRGSFRYLKQVLGKIFRVCASGPIRGAKVALVHGATAHRKFSSASHTQAHRPPSVLRTHVLNTQVIVGGLQPRSPDQPASGDRGDDARSSCPGASPTPIGLWTWAAVCMLSQISISPRASMQRSIAMMLGGGGLAASLVEAAEVGVQEQPDRKWSI